MGCDIHMNIEVSLLEGYTRPDREVRALERAHSAAPGDLALRGQLRALELRRWETAYVMVDPWDETVEDSTLFVPEPNLERAVVAWEARTRSRRRFADGFWVLCLAPDLPYWDSRNYDVFAALTGSVRNYEDRFAGIAAPRGLPVDVTPLVNGDCLMWGPDAHSASWLLASEILTWTGWEQDSWTAGHSLRDQAGGLLRMTEAYAQRFGAAYVRLVFWFDN